MGFHFYWIAILCLLMLFIPNIIWAKTSDKETPKDKERPSLLLFEKVGQVGTTGLSLFSFHKPGSIAWLLICFIFLIIYEAWWFRYFHSKKSLKDFYSSILGIPFAGATCPVIAFVFLSFYEGNPLLLAAVIILGIGHIGIFYEHSKALIKQ